MSLLQQIPDPYFSSLVLGVLYGLTFCNSACLPYVVSYVAGIGAGFRKGVIVTSIYNLGRVAAYGLLGGLAGIFKTVLTESFFLSYQKYSSIAFSVGIVLIGVSILLGKKSASGNCRMEKKKALRFSQRLSQEMSRRFDFRAFSMGFTRGLVLCPPLVALLLTSVAFSQINSVVLAVLFGLGTAISPLLILGGATGWLLNKAPVFKVWLSKIGGGILVLMGFSILLNALILIVS